MSLFCDKFSEFPFNIVQLDLHHTVKIRDRKAAITSPYASGELLLTGARLLPLGIPIAIFPNRICPGNPSQKKMLRFQPVIQKYEFA